MYKMQLIKSVLRHISKKYFNVDLDKLNYPKPINSKIKIFIIGFNKTGTTSIEKCLKGLGYVMNNQVISEFFLDDYKVNDYSNIVDFCETAEVFQDAPFSWPNTYKYLFEKYPHAKYILSERESSDVWFNSLIKFHRKIINQGEYLTATDLKNYRYRRKGWFWEYHQAVFGIGENTLYNKDIYIESYEKHNREVKEFFKDKGNLLVISLKDKDSNEKLAEFLNLPVKQVHIQHLNQARK